MSTVTLLDKASFQLQISAFAHNPNYWLWFFFHFVGCKEIENNVCHTINQMYYPKLTCAHTPCLGAINIQVSMNANSGHFFQLGEIFNTLILHIHVIHLFATLLIFLTRQRTSGLLAGRFNFCHPTNI